MYSLYNISGIYEFKATCRNSQKLSSTMVSESEIEVGPVDLEEEEQSNTIVETAALTLQTKRKFCLNVKARSSCPVISRN